jgi:L-threonylcarbamoyladenylate synthase
MGTRWVRVSVKLDRSKLVKWDDLAMSGVIECTEDVIKKAAQALKDGNLVAFPTETVYGLGAEATNERAVSRIYSVKGRPIDHPLIIHVSSINLLKEWARAIPDYALELAQRFWPGPMTLILTRSNLAKNFITGSQESVGIRVPAQPIARQLLLEFEKLGGQGIAAPSANRFGAVSPTTASDVEKELGNFLSRNDQILDGGQCLIGLESTIIDCTNPKPVILRPGAVTSEMISNLVGADLGSNENKVKTSGLLELHYSPKAKVLLGKTVNPGDGFIALASIRTPKGAHRLASPSDVEGYARELYIALRSADRQGINTIVVIPPEGTGLAEAIRDRLLKAAGR